MGNPGKIHYVRPLQAKLLDGPSNDSKSKFVLAIGRELVELMREDGWIYVGVANAGGRGGWIKSEDVSNRVPEKLKFETTSSTNKTIPKVHKKRERIIQRMIDDQVISKIGLSDSRPQVFIGPNFNSLDYSLKNRLLSVIHNYYFGDMGFAETIQILDGYSSKEIGLYVKAEDGLILNQPLHSFSPQKSTFTPRP